MLSEIYLDLLSCSHQYLKISWLSSMCTEVFGMKSFEVSLKWENCLLLAICPYS